MREYDKDKLLNLIRKSVGTRNIKSFSEAAGLSADYMYRLLKGRFSDSPRKDTLRKIAEAGDGIISYETLLAAAGYNTDKRTSVSKAPSITKSKLLLALSESRLNWGINNDPHIGFLSIKCSGVPYSTWSFICMDFDQDNPEEALYRRMSTYYFAYNFHKPNKDHYPSDFPLELGGILVPILLSDINASDKISLVTSKIDTFIKLEDLFFTNISMNMSIVLADSISNNISESILSIADGYTPQSLRLFPYNNSRYL